MAQKKSPEPRKATLDNILSTVNRGFADLEGKMDRGFAAVADDIARLDHRIDKLDSTIDRIDTKLGKFEDSEIDKRLQLEVRVAHIEKHLGIDKKIAA